MKLLEAMVHFFIVSPSFSSKKGKKCKYHKSKTFNLIESQLQKIECCFGRDINVLTQSSLNSFSFSPLQMKFIVYRFLLFYAAKLAKY